MQSNEKNLCEILEVLYTVLKNSFSETTSFQQKIMTACKNVRTKSSRNRGVSVFGLLLGRS